jgi:hypothetical protein
VQWVTKNQNLVAFHTFTTKDHRCAIILLSRELKLERFGYWNVCNNKKEYFVSNEGSNLHVFRDKYPDMVRLVPSERATARYQVTLSCQTASRAV